MRHFTKTTDQIGPDREMLPEGDTPSGDPTRGHRRLPGWVLAVWRDRRLGLAAAIGLAAAFALLSGWAMPRGPVTGTHAVIALVMGFGVGALAGFLMRSRWAMVLAPVVFVAVFELVRVGADGPTVDAPDLSSLLGVVIAAIGRGFQGVLTLVPMALGAALGAGAARRVRGQPAASTGGWGTAGLVVRRGLAAVVAIGLVVLGVLVARPGSTAAMVGADGQPLPGSVAELTRAEIGGHDLSMLIRGSDVNDPVLLFLAGGPGGAEFGAMRRHGQALEEDFVVVTLDQRGTGSSYDQIEPTSTLTLQEAVDDVAGVSNYLRERFGQDKVYLVGQSWGTTLGVLAVQAHPELFHAFVGVGQMVSQRETDRIFYEDTLSWAKADGRAELVAELVSMGPPPWTDFLNYSTVLGYEQDVYPYDHEVNAEGAGQMTESLPVSEYGLFDTVNLARGLSDSFALMYPQLQQIDFRVDVPNLDVPVYLAQGRYEPRGRADLAAEWFDQLRAPVKRWIEFPTSGHRPLFEQPELFHQVMTNTVLAASTGGTG